MKPIFSIFVALTFLLSLWSHSFAQTQASWQAIEQEVSDSWITAKIRAKYANYPPLNPLKISVTTEHGIVTLKGYAKNKQCYVDALRLAKTTQGVKGIKSRGLLIKEVNSSLTDAYITAKVEAAVLKAKVLDDESIPIVGINATTNNGVVTLSGTVKQEDSIAAILKRITAISGVKRIISQLHIKKG